MLPNISRSKENQITNIGQLIENKIENIFLKKFIPKIWWRN